MRTRLLSALVIVFAFTGEASAWNARGHMMVAAIAWNNMTPEARATATRLIRLNPNYAKWAQGVASNRKDIVAFVKAATWPDEIRNARGYTDTLPDGEEAGEAYADMLKHRDWHFKNTPYAFNDIDAPEPDEPNAQTQIVPFSAAIADTTLSDAQRSYDLSWLLHLVGDVHQPLHATARYSNSFRTGDQGGNAVKVCTRTPCNNETATSLHPFWDQAVGTGSSATGAINAAGRLELPSPSLGAVSSPSVWLDESFTLAKSSVYRTPVGTGRGPYLLTQEYRTRTGGLAERRIALAGVRLANLLNDALTAP